MDDTAPREPTTVLPNVRIGGWLIPIVVIFAYVVVKSGIDLYSWGLRILNSGIEAKLYNATVGGIIFNLIWLVFGAWTLKLLFNYDRRTPKLLIGLMIIAVLSRMWYVYCFHELAPLFSSDPALRKDVMLPVFLVTTLTTVLSAIGILYIAISKRVRNTFRTCS
ncbi:DUF2569 domain-containing protein [Phyllobacterium sp. 628]|uniref:DUF2569 family protein n=1 Tax=Phyllobacterium sp. 628 TaxID=2718938 RepID=UPI0016625CDE|nr:DUF2569 family protein [Phyllobacterium sp. 628]QND53258.1 DUF2569 domain-containing protein [Phyllobacterium sp. 628]